MKRAGMLLVLDFTDDFELARRFAAGKSDQIDFAVPGHLGFKPFRQGIDALRADAVQTSGEFIGSLPELTAGMQVGEHQLDGGHLKFRMRFDRNSAPVVAHGSGAVDVDGHVDLGAEPGKMLVNRVVQDLKDAMMQSALVRDRRYTSRAVSEPLLNLRVCQFAQRRKSKCQTYPRDRPELKRRDLVNDRLSTNNRAAGDDLQAMNEPQFVVDQNQVYPIFWGLSTPKCIFCRLLRPLPGPPCEIGFTAEVLDPISETRIGKWRNLL